jgi:hypothetical protein
VTEEDVRRIVREELAKLLSDPPAALVEAVTARLDAEWTRAIANLAITIPPGTQAPAPTHED